VYLALQDGLVVLLHLTPGYLYDNRQQQLSPQESSSSAR